MATPPNLRYPMRGSDRRNSVLIRGTITLGSSGAISSQSSFAGTAVKTNAKTGRYTLTFDRKNKAVVMLGAPGIVGPTDAAFGNTNANLAEYRNVSTSSFDIQMMLASTGADTDGASGTVIHWSAVVEAY